MTRPMNQPKTSHRTAPLALLLLLAAALLGSAPAQTRPGTPPAGQKPAPTPPATGDKTLPPIGLEQTVYLVRSALMTLNDANRSGNYTVLRDLASPAFQARNSPADLGQAFADLRRRRIDLFAVALLNPQMDRPPERDAAGRIHIVGFFPTRPLQIRFDLTFELVGGPNGQWRLFAIGVATPQAPAAAQQQQQPPPR